MTEFKYLLSNLLAKGDEDVLHDVSEKGNRGEEIHRIRNKDISTRCGNKASILERLWSGYL